MPILKYVPDWFPGAGFKRQAKIWSKLREYMRDAPFAAAKRKFVREAFHYSDGCAL